MLLAMIARTDALFSRGSLREALEATLPRVEEEVNAAPEDHLLHVDVEEWVKAIVALRGMRSPSLGEPWMDEADEVQVDVSREQATRALGPEVQTVPGYRVRVHIPFDGDGAVFLLRTNTYTYNPPVAEVGDRELIHVIEYAHDRRVSIKDSTDRLVQQVEQHLRWANEDIEQYNATLEQRARSAVQNRRARVKRHREHLAATGLPTRPSEGSPKTYIADAIVRRPAPVLPTTPTSEPIALEPVLGDEVFEHILGVIRSVGLDMERSPQTYADKGEEDRRQFLLAALNTHYHGAATAEAFNMSGKTDILIRHEGRNIFIAECKFWEGSKAFAEAIDQLFKYTAWRDTKLSLIVFVREKGLTSIIEKAREVLGQHTQLVEVKDSSSETELRATMSWPGDEQRHAELNIFFIHVPDD
jgi:hypothetical protein